MKKVTGISIKGEELTLSYFDEAKPEVDCYVLTINWKTSPEIKKVVMAAMEVIGTFLLTSNGSLEDVEQNELEDLFRKLLEPPKSES